MTTENPEERIASLERQVDALTLAVLSMTQTAKAGVFGPSQIAPSWIDYLTGKYGEDGAADVIHRCNELGVTFYTEPV